MLNAAKDDDDDDDDDGGEGAACGWSIKQTKVLGFYSIWDMSS